MEGRPLFSAPGLVVLLLSHAPGTGRGLVRRARHDQLGLPGHAIYRVLEGLSSNGLIRRAGTAGQRGGGKRWALTEAGRQIASHYRHTLAMAASRFPDQSE